jgi:malonate decarboxylase beta subunit
MSSYREANARQRVAAMFDGGWHEFVPPACRMVSPHLAVLNAPVAFDDGVIVGQARLDGQSVLFAAQEGGFMGGAVGEVHGAKITGMLQRALQQQVAAVVLLLDSGGVRLHEANAGLIAVSEIMRALLQVRAKGIPVMVLIGGANGCFGGAGILARCANRVIMSEEGRLAMSGPEVIETAHGVEEYDARDRALVWRTTGGKHRYLLGDCDGLVLDDLAAFRQALIEAIREQDANKVPLSETALAAEHAMLAARIAQFGKCRDPREIWQALGVPEVDGLSMLDADEFVARVAHHRVGPELWQDGGVMAALDQMKSLPGAAASLNQAAPPQTVEDDAPAMAQVDVADSNAIPTQPPMWQGVTAALFPDGHQIVQDGVVLHGTARPRGVLDITFAVIGTCEHTPIGVEIALQQARLVLEVVRDHPGRPILLLVDTCGQRLRHRDEMLGINSYMAHLGKCIELARQAGHIVLALVYDQALSGGFLTSGMMAHACFALPQAQIRVMALGAMARITKVSEVALQELAQHNPVFAPGAGNYWKMGGVASMWNSDLAANLIQALGSARPQDVRAQWGSARGGRLLAQQVMQMVVSDVAPA